jgi:hypothetical protein
MEVEYTPINRESIAIGLKKNRTQLYTTYKKLTADMTSMG